MNAETAYLFRHAVLRDAAEQLHLPSQRATLHLLAFDIIQDSLHGNPAALEQVAEELARHAKAALPQAGNRRQELETNHVRFLMAAFRLAVREHNQTDAVRHLDEVLELGYCDVRVRAEALRERGELARAAARGRAARDYVQQSLDLAQKHGLTELAADAKYSLSTLQEELAPGPESRRLLSECESEFARLGLELKRLRARSRLFMSTLEVGAVKDAVSSVDDLAKRFRDLGAVRDAARLWVMFARQLQDAGWYRDCLNVLAQAEPHARACNDEVALAVIEGQRGLCLKLECDYDGALDCYKRAESHNRKAGEQLGVAINASNRGNIYFRRGQYDDALQCYEEALSVALEFGAPAHICCFTMAIGNVRREQNQLELAESWYRRAVAVGRDNNVIRETAAALENLGTLLVETARITEGLVCLREAVSISVRSTPLERANNLAALGLCLRLVKRDSESEYHLSQAYSLFADIDLEREPKAVEVAANLAFLAHDRGDRAGVEVWVGRVADGYAKLDKAHLSARTGLADVIRAALALIPSA